MASREGNVIATKCSVCGESFKNFQECFKHELVNHTLNKKSAPHNRVQKILNTTASYLNGDEKTTERELLRTRLSKCKSGQELQTIIELFCMKTDNLDLIFTRIQTCIEKELGAIGIVRIYPFGSIASGLALRDCDIDIFLDVSNIHASRKHKSHIQHNIGDNHQRRAFNRISGLLARSSHFSHVFSIPKARVPIIKCKHKDTGFSIDINVSCPSSRNNTQFIYDLIQCDVRIHELMLFLKMWAKNSKIIGKGNMTSYCLITMVIFFLQQPRNSKNQATGKNKYRILKSIKELQATCPFRMVQGVNYSYDLYDEENRPALPADINTWDLIKEFFEFYQKFNFEDNVISAYYGKVVAKSDLTPELCEDYRKQLMTITQYLQGEQARNFQVDKCMCVQDPFCLNQNTAKSISSRNSQYILLCLKNAKQICENPGKLKLTELYEKLLFETIIINTNNVKQQQQSKENTKKPPPTIQISSNIENNNVGSLAYTLVPSKADLRIVSSNCPIICAEEEILRFWCLYYIDAIETIITKVYRMDMQIQMPSHKKQKKIDKEGSGEDLNKSWNICCTIDLWSNRYFQKNLQTTFMSYQLEQTERLHTLRRQKPAFSVTLNAVLKLNVLPNYKGIFIQFELPDGTSASSLNKKSPLRKFFNVFKNTLQSCSLKGILNIDKTTVKVTDNATTTANATDL